MEKGMEKNDMNGLKHPSSNQKSWLNVITARNCNFSNKYYFGLVCRILASGYSRVSMVK